MIVFNKYLGAALWVVQFNALLQNAVHVAWQFQLANNVYTPLVLYLQALLQWLVYGNN
jgi:hypothetical protein